ncbi:hypothetical protein [Belnapia sp. F-4-1]|uniref:hypothetical protein n=1 Tax=Belnapia sp. F-4-1 TaxID=1545443 RepID=UPI0011849D33|nr:hypothetical protein [Belnapia sp. F-4-1]
MPLAIRREPGQKTVVTPAQESAPTVVTRADPALVKALDRAFWYQRRLDEGRYASISKIAAAERIERGSGKVVAVPRCAAEDGLSWGGADEGSWGATPADVGRLCLSVLPQTCRKVTVVPSARAEWDFHVSSDVTVSPRCLRIRTVHFPRRHGLDWAACPRAVVCRNQAAKH